MSKKLMIALAALMLVSPAAADVPERLDFSVSPSKRDGQVQLSLRYRTDRSDSRHSRPVPFADLQGLSAAQLASTSGGPARFRIVREAGSLDCNGVFKGGRGTGDCRFAPNAGYAAQLAKRGIGAPTEDQQFQLTMVGSSLADIDELMRQGYPRPPVGQMLEMSIHGVNAAYLQQLAKAGYNAGKVAKLVEMRIHGVTPEFALELASIGPAYRNLPIDQLVEMRIHGVTPDEVRAYAKAGYPNLTRKQLINMAIHNVSPTYVSDMRAAGYRNLTPEQLVNMRIHGVNAEMARVARTAVRQN
ncbi:hypothetical protein ACFOMD_04390 [Sphingoaurantiacus capsulatus]|uniref:Uncharacterized protein n=1 Tax=Sphingoaurantiacus capsulatus TaxID=1771310 RepID=A0ABV7X6R3_9SPHN